MVQEYNLLYTLEQGRNLGWKIAGRLIGGFHYSVKTGDQPNQCCSQIVCCELSHAQKSDQGAWPALPVKQVHVVVFDH